ncbi:MAG TPA: hypothetical protein VHM30_03750 [Gemmatimonadaceae bacterium]|nr:hypothetical protein [Gemmatimonadaceae bacterium]
MPSMQERTLLPYQAPPLSQRILKAYLWFIALFHVFVGVAVNVSPTFTRMIANGYGATVDWTPQFTYILHPLGAFMIILGLLAGAAAREPERYEGVILGFVVLFAIRALHRLVYGDVLTQAFGIAPSRNMTNMIIFAAQAIALFILWRASRSRARTVTPAAA